MATMITFMAYLFVSVVFIWYKKSASHGQPAPDFVQHHGGEGIELPFVQPTSHEECAEDDDCANDLSVHLDAEYNESEESFAVAADFLDGATGDFLGGESSGGESDDFVGGPSMEDLPDNHIPLLCSYLSKWRSDLELCILGDKNFLKKRNHPDLEQLVQTYLAPLNERLETIIRDREKGCRTLEKIKTSHNDLKKIIQLCEQEMKEE
jgi:hypothetical protein